MAESPHPIKMYLDTELIQALKLYRYKTGTSASQTVRDALYAFPSMAEALEEVRKENNAEK